MQSGKRLAVALLLGGAMLMGARGAQAADVRGLKDSAETPMWWLGFQVHGVTDGGVTSDLKDSKEAYDQEKSMAYGWGVGLTLPLTVDLYHGLGLRTAFSVSYSGEPPFDNAQAQLYFLRKDADGVYNTPTYATREAFFMGGSLLVDLHFSFPLLGGAIKPYLGAGPGMYLNYVFTDITADDYFDLLDNQYNDAFDDNNIDPYSVNLEPGFNAYLGINFKVSNAMHLNFEASYDLAFMDEAPLLKASDGSEASRAAYQYSVLKISTGLLFNF